METTADVHSTSLDRTTFCKEIANKEKKVRKQELLGEIEKTLDSRENHRAKLTSPTHPVMKLNFDKLPPKSSSSFLGSSLRNLHNLL